MTLLAGSSGSAKSLLLSGNAVKWCQDNDVLPFLIDTENAIDESWLKRFDIDLKSRSFIFSISNPHSKSEKAIAI